MNVGKGCIHRSPTQRIFVDVVFCHLPVEDIALAGLSLALEFPVTLVGEMSLVSKAAQGGAITDYVELRLEPNRACDVGSSRWPKDIPGPVEICDLHRASC